MARALFSRDRAPSWPEYAGHGRRHHTDWVIELFARTGEDGKVFRPASSHATIGGEPLARSARADA